MCASNAGKLSLATPPSGDMRGPTVGRNPMYASNVGKVSFLPATFENTNGLILERDCVYVNYVGKPLLVIVRCDAMKEFTVEKNPMCVSTVRRVSLL